MFNLIDWLGAAAFAAAVLGYVWWLAKGPRARTRARIEQALLAKNLKLLDVKPKPELRLGRSSRCLLIAQAEDAFGNRRKEYFEVDVWSDLLARDPAVREVGPHLSPTRFVLRGDH